MMIYLCNFTSIVQYILSSEIRLRVIFKKRCQQKRSIEGPKKNVYYQAQTMKEVGLLRTRVVTCLGEGEFTAKM